MNEDLNVRYDYADPMMRIEKHVKLAHAQLIDKKDIDAAETHLRSCLLACQDALIAMSYLKIKAQRK